MAIVTSERKTTHRMTADEVQYALTYSQNSPFYIRSHFVFPNIHWGLGFRHELDLLSVSMKTYIGTEIEIKVSKSDIKADLDKQHKHDDERLRQLYFAVPIELHEAAFEFCPERAGIITIYRNNKAEWKHLTYQCVIRRKAKPRKHYKPFTEAEIFQLLRLGNMRYWSMFSKQFLKAKIENVNEAE